MRKLKNCHGSLLSVGPRNVNTYDFFHNQILKGTRCVQVIFLIILQLPFAYQLFAAERSPVQVAQAEFMAQNYDRAIILYRKYLRQNPRDYSAWNQLGASYFHTGLPKKALITLQKVEKLTGERSYNYFYQGLCFNALGMRKAAEQYFQYTASFNDEYGSRSVFELATIAYRNKDQVRARYWLSYYIQKYPNGVYRTKANEMLTSLAKGTYIENVQGIEKPDLEKATYRYSPLSLFNYPHYWYLRSGFEATDVEGYQPANPPLGALEQRSTLDYAVNIDAGFGIGPWRDSKMTIWGGYNYLQHWIIDQDTLDAWTSNLGDISAFPLKSTFLERTHQLYGDFRREVGKDFFLGIYGRLDYKFIGSKFFPTSEDDDLKVVINESSTTLLIPWVGYSWNDNARSLFYWYMRKEIIETDRSFSSKTYDFSGASASPTISLGITHGMEFPTINLETDFELFQYEFIYNDYWLDYTRLGGIVSGTYYPIPKLALKLTVGYYEDDYKVPRVKLRGCGDSDPLQTTPAITDESTVQNCPRKDTGYMYAFSPAWYFSQNLKVALSYLKVQNTSTKEYTEDRTTYLAEIMWAFPSVKRVTRFSGRFADFAFTKDNTQ